MTFTPTEQQWESMQKQLEGLTAQNEMLMKIAPQAQLARHLQKEKSFGTHIKVSLYRKDFDSDPRLITGWKLTKNDSYINGEGKAITNQIIRLELDEDEAVAARIKKLNQSISVTKDEDKKKELEAEREELKQEGFAEMSYFDFAMRDIVEKEVVEVTGTKDNAKGKFFTFVWREEERELHENFIN